MQPIRQFFLVACLLFGVALHVHSQGGVDFITTVRCGTDTLPMNVCTWQAPHWGIRIGSINDVQSALPPEAEGYVYLPDSILAPDGRLLPVCWVADNAFTGCNKITGVRMPESMLYFSVFAFKDCTSLREIVVPKNVYALYPNAFYGCTGLRRIHFQPYHPPQCYVNGTFDDHTKHTATIVVDASRAETYMSNGICEGFRYHAELVPIPTRRR